MLTTKLKVKEHEWSEEVWKHHAQELLNEIGTGLITPSAYDTAWVARLAEQDKDLADAALEWLCEHQLPDGSWGTEEPACYHDRIICTLSAMTTLARYGRRASDRALIKKGQGALEELAHNATGKLMANPASATVGFEMLAPMLVAEAEKLGILPSQGGHILGRLEEQRKLKLAKFAGRQIDRTLTAAFSVEMVGMDLSRLDIANLPDTNGSVAYSPSATAYYLLRVRPGDQKALAYLHAAARDGAVPYVYPADVFECAWSLWNLSLVDWSLDLRNSCQVHLDVLERAWAPGKGTGAVTGLSLLDGDCTGMIFDTTKRWGRKLDIDSLLFYESDDHFRCYWHEVDPSISTNIHLLSAFRIAGYDSNHPVVKKILHFLISNRTNNMMWYDKWHLSPYYTTAHAIIACTGYKDELVKGTVTRLLNSQKPDGSWGAILSTAEETAYAIQALCVWKKKHEHSVDKDVIHKGASWLIQHFDCPNPPLWIGKSLYCIDRVVKATVLSALGMALQELGGKL